MKLKLPSVLKFGARHYNLGYKAHLHVDDGLKGVAYHRRETIGIDPIISKMDKDITLIHEAVHIINRQFSCHLEEDNVDRLGEGFFAFLSDNFDIEFDWSNIKDSE